MTKPASIRVSFLTNLTTEVNLSVLEALHASPDIDLKHAYFFDTLSDTRGSILQTIKQHGLRRILEKVLRLTARKSQNILAKLIGKKLRPQTCYELASHLTIPHSIVQNMNAKECTDHLAKSGSEYLIVCVCKNILRQPLLDLSGCSSVNIHPSVLPEYRGPMPTYWIRKHKRSQTGVTIHLMTTGIDDGPILNQVSMPLNESDSLRKIETELFQLAADRLPSTLRELHSGVLKPRPQDENQATYYGFP